MDFHRTSEYYVTVTEKKKKNKIQIDCVICKKNLHDYKNHTHFDQPDSIRF